MFISYPHSSASCIYNLPYQEYYTTLCADDKAFVEICYILLYFVIFCGCLVTVQTQAWHQAVKLYATVWIMYKIHRQLLMHTLVYINLPLAASPDTWQKKGTYRIICSAGAFHSSISNGFYLSILLYFHIVFRFYFLSFTLNGS